MEAAWIRLSKVKGQIGGHVISGEPTAAPNLQFFANGILKGVRYGRLKAVLPYNKEN